MKNSTFLSCIILSMLIYIPHGFTQQTTTSQTAPTDQPSVEDIPIAEVPGNDGGNLPNTHHPEQSIQAPSQPNPNNEDN